MADLISLFRYDQSGGDEFLPYVIFQTEKPESLQCLSPDIMQLTSHTYVADLHIVELYWRRVADNKGLKVNDLLETVIKKNIKDCQLSLFCQHPFQGLVFFNHLKNLESQGCFRSDSLFSKKIYQNMGWYPWFLSARQINDCFDKAQCLQKQRKNFSSHLGRLSRFVERMDLREFSGLKQAHFFELSRRFKGFIGLLWKWTFPLEQQSPKTSEATQTSLLTFQHYEKLQGFPWCPHFVDSPAQVSNLLEYPVSEWEAVKESLLADLEKLSQLDKVRPPYKILELQWNLTLFDMSQVEKILNFKYPLCLEQERHTEFATLEKQLQFGFEQFREDLQARDQELQWINTPLVIGWSLEVSRGLILTEKTEWLDLQDQMQNLHRQELVSLTNKVRGGIQSYQVHETFIPGLDFSKKDLLEEIQSEQQNQLLQGPRPFYILPEEEELDPKLIKQQQFLDRTSSDWWNRQDALDSYRDCFLCELHNQEFVFAYRNYKGKWFRYGL